jgi:hypothetical protein
MAGGVLLLVVLAGLALLAYPGYREEHFADAASSRRSKLSTVPSFVPDEARDITFLTNLDTMERWGCFQLPNGTADFRSRLAAEGAVARPGQPLRKAERMFSRVPWWPEAMSEPGVERLDLPSRGGRVLMIGLSAGDGEACFYSGF